MPPEFSSDQWVPSQQLDGPNPSSARPYSRAIARFRRSVSDGSCPADHSQWGDDTKYVSDPRYLSNGLCPPATQWMVIPMTTNQHDHTPSCPSLRPQLPKPRSWPSLHLSSKRTSPACWRRATSPLVDGISNEEMFSRDRFHAITH